MIADRHRYSHPASVESGQYHDLFLRPLLSGRHRPVRRQCQHCLLMAQAPRVACSACFAILAGVSLVVCNQYDRN
jgi:hypothetical protein